MAPVATDGLVARRERPLSRAGMRLPATTLLASYAGIFCLLLISCLQPVSSEEHLRSVDVSGQEGGEQFVFPENREASQEVGGEEEKTQNTSSSREPSLAELPEDVLGRQIINSAAASAAAASSSFGSKLKAAKESMEAAKAIVDKSTVALATQFTAAAPLLGGSFMLGYFKGDNNAEATGGEGKKKRLKWGSRGLAITGGLALAGALISLVLRCVAAKNEQKAKAEYAELRFKKIAEEQSMANSF